MGEVGVRNKEDGKTEKEKGRDRGVGKEREKT